MGDPKYPRRAWRKPKRPLNYDLKMEELKTLGTFGLRTKRELWKAHTELSRVRHQARSLLALRKEDREKKEPVLMRSLERIGLVKSGSTLDDVLNLGVDDLLSRRFQTIVSKKMGFKTPYQARQAVVHGHIMIGDRRVDIPSYTVTVKEEPGIHFTPESSMPQMLEKDKAAEARRQEAAAEAEAAENGDAPAGAQAEAAGGATGAQAEAGAGGATGAQAEAGTGGATGAQAEAGTGDATGAQAEAAQDGPAEAAGETGQTGQEGSSRDHISK